MSGVVIGALLGPIKAITNRGSRQTTAGTFNFTPTVTGWHLVRLQAAGGAGGGAVSGGPTSFWGGCAGEFIEIKQYLISGTPYSYTVPGATTGATSNGASGGDAVFVGPQKTYTAKGGAGGTSTGVANTNHRRDGVATSGQPALFAAPGCVWGSNGGGGTLNGGYCGMHAGGTGNTGGGGGSSMYGVGGAGAANFGFNGSSGGISAGGGGAAVNGSPASGGSGGAGFVEFEYLGSN